MKKLLLALSLVSLASLSYASDLVWNTPLGVIGLPFSATEALIGYDAVLKQAIGGASLPVYTDPRQFVALQVGAVAPWPNNQATVQPYIAAGHDFAREIPMLAQYKTIHANVFARYVADTGKAGVGISFSYSFAGGAMPPNSGSPNPALP